MTIKMLVFDVDGTLYDLKRHEIPNSCIKAISLAKEHGYLFVIATGRAHYGLGAALESLGADYILSSNGGVIVDKKNNIISHNDITLPECEQLLSFAHKEEAGLIFKFLDHMYIYQHPEKVDWLQGQLESDIGDAPFIHHIEQNQHRKTLPQSASIHASAMAVEAFSKQSSLSFHQFSECGFDVAMQGVNKGSGLSSLMKHLHLSQEEVVCFGDNYNDLEMMEVAGYAVAMGNAVAQVKQKADFITSACDQDGIYHALQHLHCI